MTKGEKAEFAAELRSKLNSHRAVFAVDEFMFEPVRGDPRRLIGEDDEMRTATRTTKLVSAACLRLLLDYCESDWEMPFIEYCFGVFCGRQPNEGETAFDALPDVQSRLSADRLGFGHIYPAKNT